MTNLRFIPGLIFFSIALLAFSGCNKEDAAASFTIEGPGSIHFEYGQTKTVSYTSYRIASFDTPQSPSGWNCTVDTDARTVTITAPDKNDTSASALAYITVKCTTDTGSTLADELEVEVKLTNEIADPANCYLVTKADERYRFDGRVKGNESSASISPDDAVLVWTSASKGVRNVTFEDGYVYFATGESLETNSLIAVVNSDDEVLWSWHIWSSDYDPAASPDLLEGESVMNRNLGAFDASGSSSDTAFSSYGLYYQWGRKDPFVGGSAWNSTSQLPLYDKDSAWVSLSFEQSDSDRGSIEYATANPTIFLAGTADSDFDWLYAARDNSLWGNAYSGTGTTSSRGSRKSLYDPCPAGWKVAPPFIWKSFTTTGQAASDESEFAVDGGYGYGWTFTDGNASGEATQIFYPAAGRRSFSKTTGNYTNVIHDEDEVGYPVGFYWSNSNNSDTEGALMAFRKDYINPGADSQAGSTGSAEGARAGGFPVRCVKE